ncbi:hypothetical protein MAPG_02653 [Magnaporthiopsis poae ATCC 64411]|uniref:Uncharacterized protein n=1 Tax=Magnaporthiopsis poae (strain ATCC 64411 / 73-15) TaxID=644358 RepID=A0A0C4DRY5_MAGP6|nr:hypothetical protein MAPG_02653 [Magnaporthiopsis poae ATCC 64411]
MDKRVMSKVGTPFFLSLFVCNPCVSRCDEDRRSESMHSSMQLQGRAKIVVASRAHAWVPLQLLEAATPGGRAVWMFSLCTCFYYVPRSPVCLTQHRGRQNRRAAFS